MMGRANNPTAPFARPKYRVNALDRRAAQTAMDLYASMNNPRQPRSTRLAMSQCSTAQVKRCDVTAANATCPESRFVASSAGVTSRPAVASRSVHVYWFVCLFWALFFERHSPPERWRAFELLAYETTGAACSSECKFECYEVRTCPRSAWHEGDTEFKAGAPGCSVRPYVSGVRQQDRPPLRTL
ncbi:hypothetical protein MRX96_029178 [Rhipicephalus microplus]